MPCECWNEKWDRWNTRDEPKCGQLPSDFEPDLKICSCRCHTLEWDYLHQVRENSKLIKERSVLTVKLFNMEEIYEPAEGFGGGGPMTCRCEEPTLYCKNCRKRDCDCGKTRLVCMKCKGMDLKSHGY